MKLEELLMQTIPNVTVRPHFQHIEEFASFPSPGKGSLKNCLGQSKGSWKVMWGH
jgi:hypothetical protein